jgi:hypothetical protein
MKNLVYPNKVFSSFVARSARQTEALYGRQMPQPET